MDGKLDIGEALQQSFSILFRNFIPFVGITAVVMSPGIVLAIVGFVLMRPDANGQVNTTDPGSLFGGLALVYLGIILAALLKQIAAGILVYGVFQQLRGRDVTIGECASVGMRRFGPVLLTAFIVGLVTGLGTLCLVIPGLILMTMFFIAVPASVLEPVMGPDAMTRSVNLTEGNRLRIFLIAFSLWAIAFFPNLMIGIIYKGIGGTIVQQVLGIFFAALGCVAASVVYARLRQLREADVDVEQLAAVFD